MGISISEKERKICGSLDVDVQQALISSIARSNTIVLTSLDEETSLLGAYELPTHGCQEKESLLSIPLI